MKFTPFGIKNQEFSQSLRGYDKEEVRAYLEKLSNEIEKLIQENERIKEGEKELKDRLYEYKKIEKNLQRSLVSAQEASGKATEDAKRQKAVIIKEAELKRDMIIKKAEEHAKFIRESVAELSEEKELLLSRLKAMVTTQIELLEMKISRNEIKPMEENVSKQNTEINIDDIVEKLI